MGHVLFPFSDVRKYTSMESLVTTVRHDVDYPEFASIVAAQGNGTSTSRLDFEYQY